jgi:hypothetical protein
MKLEDQVCTLEQAVKLKELGIDGESLWYWVFPKDSKMISSTKSVCHVQRATEIIKDNDGDEFDHEMAAAYSVAELGALLPAEIKECKLTQWPIYNTQGKTISYGMQYRFRVDNPFIFGAFPNTVVFGDTEAIARAKLIIELLEDKTITAKECNKRLTDK